MSRQTSQLPAHPGCPIPVHFHEGRNLVVVWWGLSCPCIFSGTQHFSFVRSFLPSRAAPREFGPQSLYLDLPQDDPSITNFNMAIFVHFPLSDFATGISVLASV